MVILFTTCVFLAPRLVRSCHGAGIRGQRVYGSPPTPVLSGLSSVHEKQPGLLRTRLRFHHGSAGALHSQHGGPRDEVTRL